MELELGMDKVVEDPHLEIYVEKKQHSLFRGIRSCLYNSPSCLLTHINLHI